MVSATECAASDSIAEEWLIRPPISLAIAMPRLARPATTTVPVDSLPPSMAESFARTWSGAGAGCVMVRAVPRGRAGHAAASRGSVSSHADEVHHEDEGGAGLDDAAGAALAVRLVRGDGQPATAADLHAGDALVPALDDHADTQPELQRVAAVPGRVELLAAVVGDADVVRADEAARSRLGSVADDDVLDHEVLRGRPGGGLDVRSAQLGHGSPFRAGAVPAPDPSKQRGGEPAQTRSSSSCDTATDGGTTASGWAISSAGSRATTMATTAMTGGARPARRNVVVRPITPLTVPARAIDSGMKLRETKKSRLETRPSSAGGTRRCSSVPQMTMPAWNVAPMTAPAAIMIHRFARKPKTASGIQPRPHSRFI